MSSEPEISIIIPVYNVEEFLKKCLDSVLSQDFQDFEIVLIDDGSTDSSSTICDDYASRHERVKCFRKDNGGLSSARNLGIEVSSGRYITFIDSDDYIATNYLSHLYELAESNHADISTCYYYTETSSALKPWRPADDLINVYSSRDALVHLFKSSDIDVCAVCKLYKAELFQDIRFPNGKLFEDVGTTYKVIDQAKSLAVSHVPLYYYVMRGDSIVHSVSNQAFDRAVFADEAFEYIHARYAHDAQLALAAKRYAVSHSLSVLRNVDLSNADQRAKAQALRNAVLEQGAQIKQSEYASKLDKAALFILPFGLGAYQSAWRLFSKLRGK